MNHHWIGEKPQPGKFFGFIYVIEHVPTGRKYIGRKNYWLKNASTKTRKCKSALPDRGSDKWKSQCWRESDWASYKGSSKNVVAAMRKDPDGWTYTILKQCRSRGILTYCEVEEQWERKVLHAKLPDGEYEYFNRQIGAIKFRPPAYHTPETRKQMSAAHTGVSKSDETKAKMSEARYDKQVYTFVHEDGREFTGIQKDFYEAQGFTHQHVNAVVRGIRKTHNGWRLKQEDK